MPETAEDEYKVRMTIYLSKNRYDELQAFIIKRHGRRVNANSATVEECIKAFLETQKAGIPQ
jgi:hypothetical protein